MSGVQPVAAVAVREGDGHGGDPDDSLTGRALAMLRAVASGHAELSCSCEPDLFVDGLGCCDQYTAHQLAHSGLIRAASPGAIGQRVRAELTAAGRAVITRRLSVSA